MEVAVLGGGNGSYAAAADLADRGFAVRFWRRAEAALAPLRERGGIELTDGRGTRLAAPALVTADLGAAVRGARLIVMPLPAPAQQAMALALAPLLEDGQVVYIPPGTLGSLAIARDLAARGCRAGVAFAESGTLPYLARKHGEGAVVITGRTTRLPTGAFPARHSERTLEAVGAAYPELEPCRDALDAALLNAGPIIHPPLILMNAGPIEAPGDFDIHAEGTQPALRSVQDALDTERIAVREALGYRAPHFPLRDHYEPGGEQWMYGDGAQDGVVSSSDWREPIDLHEHRYMREDVACGLALLVSLAELAGVECPTACGLLAIASAVVGEDLRSRGRTLDSLGLAGAEPAELRALMRDGPVIASL